MSIAPAVGHPSCLHTAARSRGAVSGNDVFVGGGCEGCDVALGGEPSTTVTKDRARLVVERVRDLVAPPTYQESRGRSRSQGRLVELGSFTHFSMKCGIRDAGDAACCLSEAPHAIKT